MHVKNSSKSEGLRNISQQAVCLRWGDVSPSPSSQAGGGPLLVGCLRLLIQYISSYHPYVEAVSSICNQRTRHFLVTGTHLTWNWNTPTFKFKLLFNLKFSISFQSNISGRESPPTQFHSRVIWVLYTEDADFINVPTWRDCFVPSKNISAGRPHIYTRNMTLYSSAVSKLPFLITRLEFEVIRSYIWEYQNQYAWHHEVDCRTKSQRFNREKVVDT
jgi:hypothetical protein